MTRFTPVLASLAALALAAGCDPYDPDLGPTPFECGSGDVCPEGYTCNVDIDVCEKTGTGATIDAPAFQCENDQSLEPNDMPNNAYITPIPNARPDYALFGLAICPAADTDHFRFGVNAAGTNLEASVVGLSDRASLVVELLNTNGTVITTGAPVGGSPQQVRIDLSNRLAVGDYFIRVRAADAQENNYNITIKTCIDPLPCE